MVERQRRKLKRRAQRGSLLRFQEGLSFAWIDNRIPELLSGGGCLVKGDCLGDLRRLDVCDLEQRLKLRLPLGRDIVAQRGLEALQLVSELLPRSIGVESVRSYSSVERFVDLVLLRERERKGMERQLGPSQPVDQRLKGLCVEA